MVIVAMLFAILSTAVIALIVLLDALKQKKLRQWVLLGGAGLLIIGDLVFMATKIEKNAALYIGGILWMLAWLGFALGFVMMARASVNARLEAMVKTLFASAPKPAAPPGMPPAAPPVPPPAAPPAALPPPPPPAPPQPS